MKLINNFSSKHSGSDIKNIITIKENNSKPKSFNEGEDEKNKELDDFQEMMTRKYLKAKTKIENIGLDGIYRHDQVRGEPGSVFRSLYSIHNDKLVALSQLKHPRILTENGRLEKYKLFNSNLGIFGCGYKKSLSDIDCLGSGVSIYFKSIKTICIYFLPSLILYSLLLLLFVINTQTESSIDNILYNISYGSRNINTYSCAYKQLNLTSLVNKEYFMFDLSCPMNFTISGFEKSGTLYNEHIKKCGFNPSGYIPSFTSQESSNECELDSLLKERIIKECLGKEFCGVTFYKNNITERCTQNINLSVFHTYIIYKCDYKISLSSATMLQLDLFEYVYLVVLFFLYVSLIIIDISQKSSYNEYKSKTIDLSNYTVHITDLNMDKRIIYKEIDSLLEHVYNVMVRDFSKSNFNKFHPEDEHEVAKIDYDILFYEVNYPWLDLEEIKLCQEKQRIYRDYEDGMIVLDEYKANSDEDNVRKMQIKLNDYKNQLGVVAFKERQLMGNENVKDGVIHDVFITFSQVKYAKRMLKVYNRSFSTRVIYNILCMKSSIKHLYYKNKWMNIDQETCSPEDIIWKNISKYKKGYKEKLSKLLSYSIFTLIFIGIISIPLGLAVIFSIVKSDIRNYFDKSLCDYQVFIRNISIVSIIDELNAIYNEDLSLNSTYYLNNFKTTCYCKRNNTKISKFDLYKEISNDNILSEYQIKFNKIINKTLLIGNQLPYSIIEADLDNNQTEYLINPCYLYNQKESLQVFTKFLWISISFIIDILVETYIDYISIFFYLKTVISNKKTNFIILSLIKVLIYLFGLYFSNLNGILNIISKENFDFNSTWYYDNSINIFILYLLQSFGVLIKDVLVYVYYTIRRYIDNNHNKNLIGVGSPTISPKKFNSIYISPLFSIEVKYSRLVIVFTFTFLFGTQFPLIYSVFSIYLITLYWIDKTLLIKFYSTPIKIGTEISKSFIKVIFFLSFVALIFNIWVLINPSHLYQDKNVKFYYSSIDFSIYNTSVYIVNEFLLRISYNNSTIVYIIISIIYIFFLFVYSFISEFVIEKYTNSKSDLILNSNDINLMDCIQLKTIYTNYIYRKLWYVRFSKLTMSYSFLYDYLIDGINYDRKNIIRRLKEYTDKEYNDIYDQFDIKVKEIMEKFNIEEYPIIKDDISYNLGTIDTYKSYGLGVLSNKENEWFNLEGKFQKLNKQ